MPIVAPVINLPISTGDFPNGSADTWGNWYSDTKRLLNQVFIPNFRNVGLYTNIGDDASKGYLPLIYNNISMQTTTGASPTSAHLGASRTESARYNFNTGEHLSSHNLDNYAFSVQYPSSTINISGNALQDYDGNPDLSWIYAMQLQMFFLQHMPSATAGNAPGAINTINYAARTWDWIIQSMNMKVAWDNTSWDISMKTYGQNNQEYFAQNVSNMQAYKQYLHLREVKWYNCSVAIYPPGEPMLSYIILPNEMSISWDFDIGEQYNINYQGTEWSPFEDAPIIYVKKIVNKFKFSGILNPWGIGSPPYAVTEPDSTTAAVNQINKLFTRSGDIGSGIYLGLDNIRMNMCNVSLTDALLSPYVIGNQTELPKIVIHDFSIDRTPDDLARVSVEGTIIHPFALIG